MIDTSELEWGEVLGAGGFGEVRKATWRGTEVAVKTVNSGYSNEVRNAFIDEVCNLNKSASSGTQAFLFSLADQCDDSSTSPERCALYGSCRQASYPLYWYTDPL